MNITRRNPVNNGSLARRDPFDPVSLIDDFFKPMESFWSRPSLLDRWGFDDEYVNNTARYPIRTQTLEDGTYEWEFDVPGCDKKDLNIEYDEQNKVLSVSSVKENKTDNTVESKSFSYSIRLPEVDADSLEAKVQKGVLSITGKEAEKPETKKKIEIK